MNEEFVKALHLPNPAAVINGLITLTDSSALRIAVVLINVYCSGLKDAIAPFFFDHDPNRFAYANIKLERGEALSTITEMEKLWKEIGGQGKFTAYLFSEEIKDAYSFYIMLMKCWSFLGLLAISVACLGLLGPVSFTIRKRVKEIGIRKVLGASAKGLIVLLSKDIIILRVIASVITIPVIYFLFSHILNNTQYYSMQIGLSKF